MTDTMTAQNIDLSSWDTLYTCICWCVIYIHYKMHDATIKVTEFNPLNAELNPICPLLALFEDHHILHVSR